MNNSMEDNNYYMHSIQGDVRTNIQTRGEPSHENKHHDMQWNEIDDEDIATPGRHLDIACQTTKRKSVIPPDKRGPSVGVLQTENTGKLGKVFFLNLLLWTHFLGISSVRWKIRQCAEEVPSTWSTSVDGDWGQCAHSTLYTLK